MKLDTSVAPELALLAGPLGAPALTVGPARVPGPASSESAAAAQVVPDVSGAAGPDSLSSPDSVSSPATVGYLAACLRLALADPHRWWDLVRFDPSRPVRIPIPPTRRGCEVWLLVLPPGYHGSAQVMEQSWRVASLVAGAVSDQVSTPDGWRDHPLSPGRTRVRGGHGPYRMINTGTGYAVTLHARPVRPARTRPARTRPARTHAV